MAFGQDTVDRAVATAIVRDHINPRLTVTAIRPLHGGMVNRVEEWVTDGRPASVVAKVSPEPDHAGFRREHAVLRWYREHTTFPAPEPYACAPAGPHFGGTCLLMEKLPGRNLGAARLTARGMGRFQAELARYLADLHDHKREAYGDALEPGGTATWLERFRPWIEDEFAAVKDRLSARGREAVARMLANLGDWLPESGEPTLVHGDLWATNIIVDDQDPDCPAITGFIDGGASYADVEFELAYLLVFRAADGTFLREYTQRHPLRPGFERRCRVYWLNTIMLHVRHFGDEYLPWCERLAREVEAPGRSDHRHSP